MSDFICTRCNQPMRFNVPRLGPAGGFVHGATNKFECADQQMTTTPTPADEKVPGLREALTELIECCVESGARQASPDHTGSPHDPDPWILKLRDRVLASVASIQTEVSRLRMWRDEVRSAFDGECPPDTGTVAAIHAFMAAAKSAPQETVKQGRVALTKLEASAVLSAAGNVDPCMFEEAGKSEAPYYRGMDKLRATIAGTPYEPEQEPNEWQRAVINALVINHIYIKEHETDALKALADLVQWEVQVALDPRVSAAARALQVQAQEAPDLWAIYMGDLNKAAACLRVTSPRSSLADRLEEIGGRLLAIEKSQPQEVQVAVPKGWQLVPKEPTPEQRSAANNIDGWADVETKGLAYLWSSDLFMDMYCAMLAASPKPPREVAAVEPFKCGARASVGANDPQECNWPMCGCDPYADKVIAALQECGIDVSQHPHEVALIEPIPMLLFCPACQFQHVDEAEPEINWTNPPHRTHKCKKCSHLWRPADVHTTGVDFIKTGPTVICDPAACAAESPARQGGTVEPAGYIYEWDGPFGRHQKLNDSPYNGSRPHRSYPYYTHAESPSLPVGVGSAVEPSNFPTRTICTADVMASIASISPTMLVSSVRDAIEKELTVWKQCGYGPLNVEDRMSALLDLRIRLASVLPESERHLLLGGKS